MSYFKKFPSLEERATVKVAINLCQDDSFKEIAMRLEKPTYGFFYLEEEFPVFVSNPKKLLKLNEEKKHDAGLLSRHENINIYEQHAKPPFINDPRILSIWEKSGGESPYVLEEDMSDEISIGKWYATIDEISKKLMENIPQALKFKIRVWIKRVALEYISYCCRQEVLFDISRYFLINFLTQSDWTETCRLDEKKLAKRLVKDVQLTVLQRYHIACVYCLLDDIPRLWKKLTKRKEHSIDEDVNSIMVREANKLVHTWSFDRKVRKDPSRYGRVRYRKNWVWADVVRRLIVFGNVSLLTPFWKGLEENERQNIVIEMAVESVEYCCSNLRSYKSRKILLSNEVNFWQDNRIINYTLVSHYCELIRFFLMEMDDEQQLQFFREAFQIENCNILECFLDWTLRDYFLETINRLWGIMPINKFKDCIAVLVSLYCVNDNITLTLEYSENYKFYYDFLNASCSDSLDCWHLFYDHYCTSLFKKENQHYDYRSLLWKLWEETPQTFKQHLFHIKTPDSYTEMDRYGEANEAWWLSYSEIDSSDETCEYLFALFKQLSKKSPFLKEDEALFKLIFRDLPEIDRVPMMHSINGKDICSILLEKDKLPFVNWLLEQCFAKDQICFYKTQFIQSENGEKLCFYKLLQESSEKSLTDILDWSFEWDAEKAQFKQELANGKTCLTECKLLLCRGEFAEVERIMNFCLESDELKESFKVRCAEPACINLLNNWKIEQIDKILKWCFNTEEKAKNFKAVLFTKKGIKTHCQRVFLERWEDVKLFYQWFNLSPQEIRKLKYDTAFKGFKKMNRYFFSNTNMENFVDPFLWCLTDEEMVINFKNDVEKEYLVKHVPNKEKERLSFLVKELLHRIRKDARDETTVDNPVLRERKGKRSLKKEFLSSRKRHK